MTAAEWLVIVSSYYAGSSHISQDGSSPGSFQNPSPCNTPTHRGGRYCGTMTGAIHVHVVLQGAAVFPWRLLKAFEMEFNSNQRWAQSFNLIWNVFKRLICFPCTDVSRHDRLMDEMGSPSYSPPQNLQRSFSSPDNLQRQAVVSVLTPCRTVPFRIN